MPICVFVQSLSHHLNQLWHIIIIIGIDYRFCQVWNLTLGLKTFQRQGCYLDVIKPRTTPEGWTTRGLF